MEFLFLLIVFILFEFFESKWQKSDSLYGLILNNYYIYKKNIFLYFIFHITFFYSIFLSFYFNNFNFWMSSILVVKFLDISFKLSMMKKIDNGLSLSEIMPMNIKMTSLFRYINVLIYPLSFLFSMNLF